MKIKLDPKNAKKQFDIHICRAKENLEEAKILLEEKSYRGAISRTYYSFFEAANAALITKGLTAKTHAGVIQLFSLNFVKTNDVPAKFARFFSKAREAREEADYQFLKEFSKEETEIIIKTAEEFLKEIEVKILKDIEKT